MISTYLPELLALPLYPLLVWQGRRTRAVTPRLPEASGLPYGQAGAWDSDRRLRLLGIGESPVAGVGVHTYQQAITAQLAQCLSDSLKRNVEWVAVGQNGAKLADAQANLQKALPDLATGQDWDVVLLAFGVNDTSSFCLPHRYRQELAGLVDILQKSQKSQMRIIVSGVPPMQYFPALPWPLRTVLGVKARVLDQVVCHFASNKPEVLHLTMQMDFKDKRLMAEDGYHPSALGNTIWARQLSQVFLENRQEK
ncbi:SGNH/GDSL hydrolase family protein [Undibacterium sp. TS12]|uniref:SGNH/GDSL hydrolase family protein n=1 Tax=Undibacterium sp. TS12 TaxID=2908202 RepID=UPI001F4CC67B|nr:SGNH/GDSL hydrolase family protein [Undibacterium sp. TS12]MCH8621570.1 SGNH/GDSL hydrolase family protein [Undibacterium sp. TS12]